MDVFQEVRLLPPHTNSFCKIKDFAVKNFNFLWNEFVCGGRNRTSTTTRTTINVFKIGPRDDRRYWVTVQAGPVGKKECGELWISLTCSKIWLLCYFLKNLKSLQLSFYQLSFFFLFRLIRFLFLHLLIMKHLIVRKNVKKKWMILRNGVVA